MELGHALGQPKSGQLARSWARPSTGAKDQSPGSRPLGRGPRSGTRLVSDHYPARPKDSSSGIFNVFLDGYVNSYYFSLEY